MGNWTIGLLQSTFMLNDYQENSKLHSNDIITGVLSKAAEIEEKSTHGEDIRMGEFKKDFVEKINSVAKFLRQYKQAAHDVSVQRVAHEQVEQEQQDKDVVKPDIPEGKHPMKIGNVNVTRMTGNGPIMIGERTEQLEIKPLQVPTYAAVRAHLPKRIITNVLVDDNDLRVIFTSNIKYSSESLLEQLQDIEEYTHKVFEESVQLREKLLKLLFDENN